MHPCPREVSGLEQNHSLGAGAGRRTCQGQGRSGKGAKAEEVLQAVTRMQEVLARRMTDQPDKLERGEAKTRARRYQAQAGFRGPGQCPVTKHRTARERWLTPSPTMVTEVRLRENRIGDKGAKALAAATEINLGCNHIGEEGTAGARFVLTCSLERWKTPKVPFRFQ